MKYNYSFIMLTGFTMKSGDMKYFTTYLQRLFSKDTIINFIYVKPPTRKITCYDGEKYRAWYDYLKEDVTNTKGELNVNHLLEQNDKIHKIIDKENKRYNDYKKIFICGYSQGATMALSAGLSYPHKLGGILVFKGHIPREIDDYLTVKQDIWATNSKSDDTIPFGISKEYFDKYIKKGYNITFYEQDKPNHNTSSGIRGQMKSLRPWLENLI